MNLNQVVSNSKSGSYFCFSGPDIYQMQTWQGYRANIDDKGGENWATSYIFWQAMEKQPEKIEEQIPNQDGCKLM